MSNISEIYRRGDIIWVDLGQAFGCEQGGIRPAVIVQNNTGNQYSPCLIVLPLTNSKSKAMIPTQVYIKLNDNWSIIYGEQIRVIDKRRVHKHTHQNITDMEMIDEALRISLAL